MAVRYSPAGELEPCGRQVRQERGVTALFVVFWRDIDWSFSIACATGSASKDGVIGGEKGVATRDVCVR